MSDTKPHSRAIEGFEVSVDLVCMDLVACLLPIFIVGHDLHLQ